MTLLMRQRSRMREPLRRTLLACRFRILTHSGYYRAFANASAPSSIDRTVVVPAHKKFYQYPWSVYGQSNITLQIDGTIVLQQNVSAWPRIDGSCADAINFTTCDQLVVQGSGTIDGQGFEWWVLTLENKLRKGGRPRMFNLYDSSNVEIKDVTMINSPQFHMRFQRVANVTVHGVTIWVNVEKQKVWLCVYLCDLLYSSYVTAHSLCLGTLAQAWKVD